METILDKALRTAVVRLADSDLTATASASSTDLVDRSDQYRRPPQQEYPSYDYDEEYYENYQEYSNHNDHIYKDYSVYKPTSKDYNIYKQKSKDYNIYKPQSAPPWASPRPPPHRPSFPPLRPPPNRPPFIPPRGASDRVSETSSGPGLVSWLPGLALLPIIAGLSYYFVVENAPTPVVRERGGEAVIVRHLESGPNVNKMWGNLEHWGEGLVSALSNCPEDQEDVGGAKEMSCLIYQRISKMFMDNFIKLDTQEKNQ